MIFNPGGVINTAGFFPDGAMMAFLEFNNISKGYPGVQALSSVSFGVDKGAIHGLMGENGAGKSTLIRILSGDQAADQGSILIGGEEQRYGSTRDAFHAGVIPRRAAGLTPDRAGTPSRGGRAALFAPRAPRRGPVRRS